jgi:hypothetical protein
MQKGFIFDIEANHNKDYSVVKTFTGVPPHGGIVVLSISSIHLSIIHFKASKIRVFCRINNRCKYAFWPFFVRKNPVFTVNKTTFKKP